MDFMQMSIFDLLPPDQRALEDLTEKEMVEYVGNAVGIPFEYKDSLFGWQYTKGKVTFDIRFGKFSDDKKKRFIHAGWTDRRNGYGGCGVPCRSLEEAIDFFKKKVQDVQNG